MQQLCFLSGLTSEQWASWVQAVGSILALAVAIALGVWQTSQARKEHRARTDARFAFILKVVEAAVEHLGGAAAQTIEALELYPSDVTRDTMLGLFDAARSLLEEISPLELQDGGLAGELIALRKSAHDARYALAISAHRKAFNVDGMKEIVEKCDRTLVAVRDYLS
jgi:hypothetical protein